MQGRTGRRRGRVRREVRNKQEREKRFGKCVSQKAEAAGAQEAEADVSAAKVCKAERKADSAAFRKKYANLGKCVSTRAKTK
jgi:hypothetical protein